MATLTFSFDTGSVPISKIIDAFASQCNYQPILPSGQLNPEIKADFVRRILRDQIINIVKQQDINKAVEAAASVITPIVLT